MDYCDKLEPNLVHCVSVSATLCTSTTSTTSVTTNTTTTNVVNSCVVPVAFPSTSTASDNLHNIFQGSNDLGAEFFENDDLLIDEKMDDDFLGDIFLSDSDKGNDVGGLSDLNDASIKEAPIDLNGTFSLTKHQRKRRNKKNRLELQKSNGVSGEASSTPTGTDACSASSLPTGGDGKRRRSKGSPTDAQQEQKRKKTYASVVQKEEFMKIGVLDKSNATGFSEEKRSLLNALIHNGVITAVENNNIIPKLRGNFLQGAMLIFNCLDEMTVTWLKDELKRINVHWEGSSLCIIDNPVFVKIKMWIPGPVLEIKRVFTLLEKFNEGLVTELWRPVGKINHGEKGQLVFVFVDPVSMTYIKNIKFKLQFVMNNIILKIAGDKPAI